MPTVKPGVVSVVLVNFRGTDDTLEAITRLGELDWPSDRLEIVVVENGSGDDSAERIAAAAPHVTLLVSTENNGFAGGCNQGVAASSGEYIALLNNDAKPDPRWIAAAVARFEESEKVGAVASRVLDWDGELVDYIGSAMTWYGMGYKPYTAEPVPSTPDHTRDVLFGTGSAMFVRRSVFEELGGFDERYFMFFEDVDLGWRLNLAGYRFVYEPESLAFHKHHASMSKFGSHKETYLLERNALFTLYKNAGKAALDDLLPAAMGLSIRRGVTRGELDSTSFDLRKGGSDEPTMEFPTQTVAAVYAIDQFVAELPGLTVSRDEIQRTRVVSERAIWSLFGQFDAPIIHEPDYLAGYDALSIAFDVASPKLTTKVVVVTGDPIGAKIAGPAIRAWNMAAALSRVGDVVLVSLSGVDGAPDAPFRLQHVASGNDRDFSKLEAWADVIVFQGSAMSVFESLRRSQKVIVVDIYDPMHLEQLEQGRELGSATWHANVEGATEVLNEQLARGDFFMAASERQKHFYLGQLAALGRITPTTYDGDPDFDGFLSVVPFGIPAEEPVHERDVLKGVRPGFGRDDKVLLWSGGLYNWFDPATLIRAVATVDARRGGVRLFFQGTKHPHPDVPEMRVVSESRALAAELGVADTAVFFNDSWVDYADRQNYLLEADAGVSTHFSHVETTFSFRTRILDYLWAGLPMVVTDGDHFADLIRAEGLGIVVPAEDPDALADALETVLFDGAFAAAARENIARVRERYRWDVVLKPLVDFVADPHHAADWTGDPRASRPRSTTRRRSGLAHNVRQTLFHLRHGGVKVALRKVRSRLGLGS
ncbi:GT2 family glycosyltransferase/glycosyltransferase involved in cell wall biosynthesis [Microbacteriaceae bacterium SG_E_30_P1]|uniref:GT2 family glycosyltransferase/glycosyltransferase involved in cell wall biosynthesis n=1 Tax=Antiquaquibacter oligotrophicus TaxID=2880260 RepID=A0ABT6KQD7_9MICO|nr:glycosyltransferase [Antiquaquibacter oligotrophicus]MDH6181718.1 GT2 family glycosyltransferase/glycosyltransferase involved in cell wall biosynthesis [Antiquaquibacter oligotrophicus]UDF12599.1 glycosyltransferase [Antiquaquibacter oligotrophicus]